jgi:hypothetical protein
LTGKGSQLYTTLWVGTPSQSIQVGFDSRYSTLILTTPVVNSTSANYNPYTSTTDSTTDPFREKDGLNSTVVGHYYTDRVCFATQGVTLKATQSLGATTASSSSKAPTTSSSVTSSSSSVSSNATNSTNSTVANITSCVDSQLIFGAELLISSVSYAGEIGLGL